MHLLSNSLTALFALFARRFQSLLACRENPLLAAFVFVFTVTNPMAPWSRTPVQCRTQPARCAVATVAPEEHGAGGTPCMSVLSAPVLRKVPCTARVSSSIRYRPKNFLAGPGRLRSIMCTC